MSIADKIDTLTGIFAIGQKPSGTKDPFALRRAALGVIRIVLENRLRFPLNVPDDVLVFFAGRLKVALKEKGVRHDLIDAVFSLGREDDLVRLVERVKTLEAFLSTDDGANLLAGYKRAANILRIEEKKDNKAYTDAPNTSVYQQTEEKALAEAIGKAKTEASAAVAKEDFAAAMSAMAKLRPGVDAFFDKVLVNDPDPKVRENRLRLLTNLINKFSAIADFSEIVTN